MLEESIRSTGGNLSGYLRSIIGSYTPTDPTSMAGADWEYIISAILLLMSFYFVYKLFFKIFK